MAVTYGFYNSLNKDRVYSAEQMSSIFNGIITDGVFSTVGDTLMTVAGSGMQVIVKPGRAWFNSTWTLNDAQLPLAISTADVSLARIDAVVLEVNSAVSVRENDIKVLTGTASANPTKPTLASTETLHQYALAYVTVNAGATSITNANIAVNVGKTGCPFITSVLQQTDVTDLFNQWDAEFTSWFENVQSQLAGDVAANLQNQISGVIDFGYGKNGNVATNYSLADYTALTTFLTQELADMSIVGTAKLISISFSGGTGWPYGSGIWSGELRYVGSAANGTIKTAAVELSSHAFGKVLLRRDTDGTWSHCKVASTSDVKALYNVGDIKFTQAKVTEGAWVKCDGRSFNANSAPLNAINGIISGAAVERIIAKSALNPTPGISSPFLYLNNEIIYPYCSNGELRMYYYNTQTGSTRSQLIRNSDYGTTGSCTFHDMFYVNNRVFLVCYAADFFAIVGTNNTAHCIFSYNDVTRTWVYSIIESFRSSQSPSGIISAIQFDTNTQKYLFQMNNPTTTYGINAPWTYSGVIGDTFTTIIQSGGLYRTAIFNPQNQKYIKFISKDDSSDQYTSYLYLYETTNIADTGASASNLLLIHTNNSNTNQYKNVGQLAVYYTKAADSNNIYLVIYIGSETKRDIYNYTWKIIDMTNRTVREISSLTTNYPKFLGINNDIAPDFVCNLSGSDYNACVLEASTNRQLLLRMRQTFNSTYALNYAFQYEKNKYLVGAYDYFLFASNPNGYNNKVIVPPLISGTGDANYYMKIAEET